MNDLNSTPETIVIQLTKGQITIVDAIDADLAELKWVAQSVPKKRAVRSFYARRTGRNIESSDTLLHRVILARIIGRHLFKSEFVDHINGNPLDNRRDNLRLANPQQNAMNKRHMVTSASPYKGASFDKAANKWRAQIQINGKKKALGYFATPEEAHKAYCDAAKKHFGEFSNFG